MTSKVIVTIDDHRGIAKVWYDREDKENFKLVSVRDAEKIIAKENLPYFNGNDDFSIYGIDEDEDGVL